MMDDTILLHGQEPQGLRPPSALPQNLEVLLRKLSIHAQLLLDSLPLPSKKL